METEYVVSERFLDISRGAYRPFCRFFDRLDQKKSLYLRSVKVFTYTVYYLSRNWFTKKQSVFLGFFEVMA